MSLLVVWYVVIVLYLAPGAAGSSMLLNPVPFPDEHACFKEAARIYVHMRHAYPGDYSYTITCIKRDKPIK